MFNFLFTRGRYRTNRWWRAPRQMESLEARQLLHGGTTADTELVAEGELDQIVPDFSLTDVNPTSSRYNEAISPRDYLGGISAWYFGHST